MLPKLVKACAFGLMVSACATPQLVASKKSTVYLLGKNYGIERQLGNAPVDLPEKDKISRFKVEPEEGSPEYLLVLFPESVSENIDIKMGASDTVTVLGKASNEYFDRVLHAHRLLLQGLVDQAEDQVQMIASKYGDGFGTLVISANIAISKGKGKEAKLLFRRAASLISDPEKKEKLTNF